MNDTSEIRALSKEAILQLHDKILIKFKLDLRVGRLYAFYFIVSLIVTPELGF